MLPFSSLLSLSLKKKALLEYDYHVTFQKLTGYKLPLFEFLNILGALVLRDIPIIYDC